MAMLLGAIVLRPSTPAGAQTAGYRRMPLAEFLQTDAAINTGNSGGPMFSMAGQVVGIVSHNISKSGGSEGLGFVVTINTQYLPGHRGGQGLAVRARGTPGGAT
jgi:S1-C subfamily serine protease